MKKKVEIKCRNGVAYSIEAAGSKGSVFRLKTCLRIAAVMYAITIVAQM